jgi:hypothetical protein
VTIVESLALDLCLPFVARMRRESGCVASKSGNSFDSAVSGKVSEGAL